jgi:glycosyltransferase involved in cell wall biosynthesis
LLPRKDVGNIIRALALLRRRFDRAGGAAPLLLVVGGATHEPDPVATPEIGTLQRLATGVGVADLVRFVGHRQPADLRTYYGAADVAVTTPWYEPFGLTPLEAMACGRPVIGAAVGGIPFTVRDGVTGYLVPPHDPAALADRLEQVLTRPELRERLGHAGRAWVELEFSWQQTAARTATLYQAVLAAHATPAVVTAR